MAISRIREPFRLGVILILLFIPLQAYSQTFSLVLNRLEPVSPVAVDSGIRRYNLDSLCRMTSRQFVNDSTREIEDTENRFASLVTKEPEYKCRDAFRNVFNLGGTAFPFALDSTNLPSLGYDILYTDVNLNGDLTDDGPIPAIEGIGPGTARCFPRIDLRIDIVDGQSLDCGLLIVSRTILSDAKPGAEQQRRSYVSCSSGVYRTGTLEIQGKSHKIVLLDYNCDGRFDSEPEIIINGDGSFYLQGGDVLLMDPNPGELFAPTVDVIGHKARHYISELMCIDNKFYRLKPSPPGDTVTVTPVELPAGRVVNNNPRCNMLFYSADLGLFKTFNTKPEPIVFPVGEWSLVEYRIDTTGFREDGSLDKGTYLNMSGRKGLTDVKVVEGETLTLPFGATLKTRVFLTERSEPDEPDVRIWLNFQLVGPAGEVCDAYVLNGDRPDKPTFIVADNGGKILQRGTFEYG